MFSLSFFLEKGGNLAEKKAKSFARRVPSNQGFVDFRDYFGLFSTQIAGVIFEDDITPAI